MATTIKGRQLTFNSPRGYLINGKISPTVASNNLTVAIKTLAGNDPSASDPVYCRIGDTIRTISAALSVTKNAGTNWCNAGSSELATKEIDYFVYLGYNATDGTVIGFSRIPYAQEYSEFSATTTNEKYCAISTITTAASGDDYEVVGRFAATLSAGAGYTWTVPTFTNINLVNRPTYDTRWLNWTPAITATGSMTISSTVVDVAKYKVDYNIVFHQLRVSFTTGGVANNGVLATHPFTSVIAANMSGGGATYDGGTLAATITIISSSNNHQWLHFNYANWNLGASKYIMGNHFYSI